MLHEQLEPDVPAKNGLARYLSFGPFVLDRCERVLLRRGVPVELPERSFRLLEILLRSAGRTVSKERLVEKAWPGICVSDSSLAEAMSRLRHALGDAAREPIYIRTVHRRGYRFIAPIRRVRHTARQGAFAEPAWMMAPIAATLMLVGAFWVVSAMVDAVAEGRPVGSRALSPPVAFDPLQPTSESILRLILPRVREERPRYRLAKATLGESGLEKFRIPALPLNEISVDRARGRVAFSLADRGESDIWVAEPRRGSLDRVASGGQFSDPVWMPDGRALAMAQKRDGSYDIVVQEAAIDGRAQVLLAAPLDQFPESWSRDGASLVYSERHPETGFDLWLLRRGSADRWIPTPLVRSADNEAFGAISPNGRYVAFTTTVDRRPEVFVVDLGRDRVTFRVSHDGGAHPFWSATGEHLYYLRGDEVWSAATDRTGGELTSPPRRSTSVAGLYLAGAVAPADKIVVAMLDGAGSSWTFRE